MITSKLGKALTLRELAHFGGVTERNYYVMIFSLKVLQTLMHDTATICGSLLPQVRAKLITSTNSELWRGDVIDFTAV